MSSEHDVSLMSGKSILEKIDKNKYETTIIYIKKNGKIYEYTGKNEEILQAKTEELIPQNNIIDAVEKCDVIFPVLHGKYGEDGCIQGILETINKPYVGCGVCASSVCMDKEFTKKLVAFAHIPVAKGVVIKKQKEKYTCDLEEKEYDIKNLCEKLEKHIKFPMFVKPTREGSSIGVQKASTKEELIQAIKEAEKFDTKILAEEAINGKEIECAVLGNDEIISSEVGEVQSAENFYTYDAKYNNPESQTIIPAKIQLHEKEKIKKYAELAFKAVGGKGLARVDFFLKENGEIILNEINTMPGFTKISMYPKLFEKAGIEYSKLIDKLIELALEK